MGAIVYQRMCNGVVSVHGCNSVLVYVQWCYVAYMGAIVYQRMCNGVVCVYECNHILPCMSAIVISVYESMIY